MKNRTPVPERLWARAAAGSLAAVSLVALLSGCTSRAMTITSLPPGAEVSINHRVVGRTPIRVDYTHYGSYRIELRKERYQTLVREENLRPPYAYGYDPATFVADNLIPARIHDEAQFHYILQPITEKFDRDTLMDRATQARDGKVTHPGTQRSLTVAMGELKAKTVESDLPPGAPPSATVASAAAAGGGPAAVPRPEGPPPAPVFTVPAELRTPPVGITEKPPEAPPGVKAETPAVKPPGEKPPTPAKVEPGKEPGVGKEPAVAKEPVVAREPGEKAVPPAPLPPGKRMRRTPKGEILIYDEPAIEDIEKK